MNKTVSIGLSIIMNLCFNFIFIIRDVKVRYLMTSSSSSSSFDAPLSSKTLSQPLLVLLCPGGKLSCASSALNDDASCISDKTIIFAICAFSFCQIPANLNLGSRIVVVYKIPYRRARAWPRPSASREQRYLAYKDRRYCIFLTTLCIFNSELLTDHAVLMYQ